MGRAKSATAIAVASAAYGQETTGTISGRTVDAQGLAVPGVKVTVTGPQGARETMSGADGNFTVPFLTPGTYTIRGELPGFKTFEQQNAVVSLGHALGVTVTGEGVETKAQLKMLRDLGVDAAQGYLFAPPQPASDLTPQLLRPHAWI